MKIHVESEGTSAQQAALAAIAKALKAMDSQPVRVVRTPPPAKPRAKAPDRMPKRTFELGASYEVMLDVYRIHFAILNSVLPDPLRRIAANRIAKELDRQGYGHLR